MEDQPTCGKGLAEHSVIPAKLGEWIDSLAEVLTIHMGALDLDDKASMKEHKAYEELAREHRSIAAQLRAAAGQMAGYRDLPMGEHHLEAMSGSMAFEAFEKFVKLEEELATLLEYRIEQDRRMLGEMGGAGRSS